MSLSVSLLCLTKSYIITGSAVVYSSNNGGLTWTFLVQLFPSIASLVEAFGSAVAMYTDIIVVGAPLDDIAGLNTGAVLYDQSSRPIQSPWS